MTFHLNCPDGMQDFFISLGYKKVEVGLCTLTVQPLDPELFAPWRETRARLYERWWELRRKADESTG